jgi:serine/threonine protein kinase
LEVPAVPDGESRTRRREPSIGRRTWTPVGDGGLPLEALMHLDDVCDRYESAWLDGQTPDLTTFLADAPESARSRLFRELLALDVEYALRRGELPDLKGYRDRFPADLDAIDAVFSQQKMESKALSSSLKTIRPGGGGVIRSGDALQKVELNRAALEALRAAGYEVEGELGRGGMGVVYRARKVALNRTCALKMILAGGHAGSAASKRFMAEAETIARLRHPDVVQIYHVGEADGLPYLELEYFPGGSLDRVLDGTPWPAIDAAELVVALTDSIAAAHQQGVIHRDLKPANILLDEDGRPKVADFGLAKVLDSDDGLTKTQMVLGSPCYMAPEQAEGHSRRVGATTDLYALGAVLYELLTGRPPFRAATVLETLALVKHADPVPPTRLVPGLPRDAETICLKCLEKDPAARYPSAEALADDLRRFLKRAPILAHPASWQTRAWKWARARPAIASALGIGVASALVLLGGALYYNTRLRHEVLRARNAEKSVGDQRNLALAALNRLVYDVQERLGDSATTRPLRQSLLDTAISGLDQVAQGAEASAPDLSRAVAHSKLGSIYMQVGRSEEGERQLNQARELAERLITATPQDSAVTECLRGALAGLGEHCIKVGRIPEAKSHFRRVVELAEQLATGGHGGPSARRGLLEAYLQLGRAYGFGNEPDQAEKLYTQMNGLARQWVREEPGNTQARDLLAISLRKLGDARKAAGDLDDARSKYLDAIAISRELLAAEPGEPRFKFDLAVALDDLAGVTYRQRRSAESRSLYVEAERLFNERLSADPEDLETQLRLVYLESDLARIESDDLQYAKAVETATRALERLRRLNARGLLVGLEGSTIERTKALEAAIAEYESRLRALPPSTSPAPG